MSESQNDDELESQNDDELDRFYDFDEFCDKFQYDGDHEFNHESDDELESQNDDEFNRMKFHGAMADEMAEKHIDYNPYMDF